MSPPSILLSAEATALLIVDAQANMFDSSSRVYDADRLLRVLQDMAERARSAGVRVVYVRHCGAPGDVDEPGTPGWRVAEAVAPRPGEAIVDKRLPDSFEETSLSDWLDARGIRCVVVTGMQTDSCIAATARGAHARGFEAVVVEDGHTTFDSDGFAAADLIRRHNQALRRVAYVLPGEAIRFQPSDA